MRKRLRWLAVPIAAEIVATLMLLVIDRQWHQTRATPPAPVEQPAIHRERSLFVLHPYAGYTLRPGLTVERLANGRETLLFDGAEGAVWSSVKSIQAQDSGTFIGRPFPYARQAGELVVGLFGGSTANWLALQAGSDIARHLSGALARDVVVLNFAIPGGKQPQQLAMLNHAVALGQVFDVVVNIDGYNEVVFGGGNVEAGVASDMPSIHVFNPLWKSVDNQAPSAANVRLLADHLDARETAATLSALRAANPSAALEIPLRFLNLYVQRRADSALADLIATPADPANDVYVLREARGARLPDAYTGIAEHWQRASTLMAATAQSLGAAYVHLLQPHPHSGGHKLDAAERTIVMPDNPASLRASAGYPALLNHVPALQGDRAAFVSAIQVFDEIAEPVYADLVHPNIKGGRILARFVADTVAGVLRSKPSHDARQ